jgi:hypothetical protein
VSCVWLGWLQVLVGQVSGEPCVLEGLVGQDWLVGRVLFVCGVCGWACVGCAQWLCWGWVCGIGRVLAFFGSGGVFVGLFC